MAFSQITSGTLTANGSEQTLSTQTIATRYQTMVDLSAMVNGDTVILKIKVKCLTGGSAIQMYSAVYANVQANPLVALPEVNSLFSYAVTLQQTTGSNHNYDWSMNDVQRSEPPTPPTVVQIRQEMDSNSTKLANLDATVSSRSTYAGGAVASVTAAVTVGTNNDKTGYALTSGERTSIADALLDRDLGAGADTVSRSVRNALRVLRNKFSISGTTVTYTKEDDATTAFTAALTTDAAAIPITASDPT